MNATASPLATSQKSSVYLAIAGDVTGSITRLNSDSAPSPGLRLFGTRKRSAPFSLSSLPAHPFFFFSLIFLVLHESLAENVGQIKATADVRPALPIPSSVCSIIFFFFKLFSFLFPSLPPFFFFLSSLFPSSPSFYFFRTHLPLPPPPLSFFLVGLFLLLLLDLFFPSFFPQCSAETPETWFYDVVLKSHKISKERKLFFVFFYTSQSAGVLILFQMLFKLLSVCFIKTVKRVWFCH